MSQRSTEEVRPGSPTGDRRRRDDLDSLGRRWNGAYSGQGRRSRYRIYTPVVIGKLEGDGLAFRIGDFFFRASAAAAHIGRKEMTGQKKRGDRSKKKNRRDYSAKKSAQIHH